METVSPDQVRAQLQDVLQALEAMRPGQDAQPLQALANPAQRLAQARNAVIAAQRAGRAADPPDLLPRLNRLASVMAGIEYPLAGVHWPRIEQLRKELGALVAAMDPGSTGK